MRKLKIPLCGIVMICCLFSFSGAALAGDFIKTFLCRIGGTAFYPGDELKMAKYDIIFANKFHYNDIEGNTWNAIKAINPEAEIYPYTTIHCVHDNSDATSAQYLNNLGRYNVSRSHSMGSLNGNNPGFFLLDSSGNRVKGDYNSRRYYLDFGNSSFQQYSIEATKTDYIGCPWLTDGVYTDLTTATKSGVASTPVKYDTNTKWSAAMNSMLNAMTAALHAAGQKFACNRGGTTQADGYAAWVALDNMPYSPDVVLEEGAFAVSWGSGEVQFYPEDQWKRQVDILASTENSDVCFMSHVALYEGENGTDNYGISFNYWDALWYSLGSYLLGKNDSLDYAYFLFRDRRSYNCVDYYFDEYDKIDLGPAAGGYHVTNYSGINIYWREFADGYIYVNPTYKNVTAIFLPETCKQMTHYNLTKDPGTLSEVNTITLNGHRAAILYKGSPSPLPPLKPMALRVLN